MTCALALFLAQLRMKYFTTCYGGSPIVDRGRPPSIYHWSPLHVISPPRTLTPSHLHCHAHGYPPPIVTWSTLPLSPSLTPSPLPLPHSSQLWNGSLILNTLRTNDTRIYRCDATNLLGTVSMETILFVDASKKKRLPMWPDLSVLD